MKNTIKVLLSLIISSCFAMETSAQGTESTTKPFVTVRDGHFYLGNKEYRYVGANFWYGAILASEGRGGNRERLHRELDHLKSIGVDNVRVLVGGDGRDGIPSHIAPKLQTEPGVYNDTILAGLDYLMLELEKRDMRAILYLNNAWEWSGGYGAYLDWAGFESDIPDYSKGDGSTRHFSQTPVPGIDGYREYTQHVSNFVLHEGAKAMADRHACFIVSRKNRYTGVPYSQSPALMAWEIANEPRAFNNDELHKRKFVEWIDRQSRLIRAIDPNHLITTGSEGRHGCEQDMQLFRTIHTLRRENYMEKIKRIEEISKQQMQGFTHPKVREVRIMGACTCVEVYDPKDLEGFQQFAYERGVFSRPFLSYMYSMVPYIIKEDELIRIFDTMKAWFMKF